MTAADRALVTGVGRRQGVGAGIAARLAADGWDLALSFWHPYDSRAGHGFDEGDPESVAAACRDAGVQAHLLPADLADPEVPDRLVRDAAAVLGGPITALVMSHAESVDSSVLDTSVESWERHFAVNARASWLLIEAVVEQLPSPGPPGDATGRIVALTSDHTVHNLPYGASKGALDRLVIAAGVELADRGVRANVVDPGPIDTGWMTPELRGHLTAATPTGRLGTPSDTADLVAFLLSPQGAWINAQLLSSNGGFGAG